MYTRLLDGHFIRYITRCQLIQTDGGGELLLNFKESIRLEKKGEQSDVQGGVVVATKAALRVSFHSLLIYWSVHTRPLPGLNGPKK